MKQFCLSLKGRNYLPDGTSEALEIANILDITQEKRIETSLTGTELDIPKLRVINPYNSKLPKKLGWLDINEEMSIGERLSSYEMYNYSIKTGELEEIQGDLKNMLRCQREIFFVMAIKLWAHKQGDILHLNQLFIILPSESLILIPFL